ncbi:Protein of unknown function (DUF3037) [Nocardioides sp. J9]|uniref:DUF3037 domain-containing protein n=1 Tax=Nocardioides sp. J9 TaxID=935844 RepID=UPI0011A8DD21|nr:DUF3037 domain-containing protein [Nocardioides sp. J9]TWG95838.1 Protein of unknown function (DUF3037) [Nocardioides sp. J9]
MSADRAPGTRLDAYQYVTLRCVPRVEREEFVNVGVVLHCPQRDFLGVRTVVDEDRLRALHGALDLASVRGALASADRICRGEEQAAYGAALRATAYGTREAREDLGTRFGLLKAPRSTVVQPSPVHGGLTADPEATLEHLVRQLVG